MTSSKSIHLLLHCLFRFSPDLFRRELILAAVEVYLNIHGYVDATRIYVTLHTQTEEYHCHIFMTNKEQMTPYLDLTILVCLHFNRLGSLVKSMIPPLKLELFCPVIDSGMRNIRGARNKVYLLRKEYWYT